MLTQIKYWVDRPFNDKHIAYMIMGYGYIPFSPYGGRHIMDDFGNLVQALPSWYH